MKILNFSFSILLLSLFVACSNNKEEIAEHPDTIIFNVDFDIGDDESTPLKLSEIIDSISYIQLQSDENNLMGEIGDIKYFNDRYYIHDLTSSSIYIVDKRGSIINKISNIGRARNEYIALYQFDVNPSNGEVSIFDGASKRIQVYCSDGGFLRSTPVHEIVRDFAVLANGDYLLYTPDFMQTNLRGLWKIDAKGEFKEQLVTIDDDFLYGGLHPKYFRRIDDNTIGLMGGEDYDRIYHITADTILVKYKINVAMELPNSVKSKSVINYEKYKGQVYVKHDYLETDNLLVVTLTDMERDVMLFYDKRKNKLKQIKQSEQLIEDMDIFGPLSICSNNRFIGLLQPRTVLNVQSIKDKFPDIKSDSNPILVVTHLK